MIKACIAAALVAAVMAGGTAAAADPFVGAWMATDPFDGSSLRLQIGSPSASGVRSMTLTDGYASACGAPATAIGTGTVSGSTLTAVVNVRCGGEPRGELTIVYTLAGDALTDGYSTFVRVTRDEFSGAWTATDPFDASTLRLQVGAPSASGRRHVTLTDDFASACGAPATAIGAGTVSGATLTATVIVRCGGEVRGELTIAYTLAGDALTDGYSTFTRTGS